MLSIPSESITYVADKVEKKEFVKRALIKMITRASLLYFFKWLFALHIF